MDTIGKALSLRYPPPAFAVFFEVANGPGSTLRRYADALVMSLFPSRGLDLHGFEFKSSRSDWLSELKKPEKADEIAKYCDFWWLVTGWAEKGKDIAKLDELPAPWGWLTMTKSGELRQKKAPKRLDPVPLDRKMVAAIARRAEESSRKTRESRSDLNKQWDLGYSAGQKAQRSTHGFEMKRAKQLEEQVKKFREASGVNIDCWSGGDIGEAVRAVIESSPEREGQHMEYLADDIIKTGNRLKERAKALKDFKKKEPADA